MEDVDFCIRRGDHGERNDDNGDLDGTKRSRDGRDNGLHAVHML